MKLKSGFLCREVAGQWVVVPLGERVVEFNGIMTLSESGALLLRTMENEVQEEELVQIVLNEYIVDEESARSDIREFVTSLKDNGLLIE
ncbi:PqqD family protein [Desulfosporosinus hippei]|uniref:Coenzyme PQQ synthesis protein D (PqqD) n=1 Tax=Desulfosporosinus hippei DSM 8344 TaxID=1121419 RepID=A0A1G8H1X7_9FIRM|nr:PqqD family protein [Desulfosporosinus hippei]SDI00637.1 Coenzyme PQQ synthesis protein D (PqqD) [Desulfosporosinus hippei DSM 8344]